MNKKINMLLAISWGILSVWFLFMSLEMNIPHSTLIGSLYGVSVLILYYPISISKAKQCDSLGPVSFTNNNDPGWWENPIMAIHNVGNTKEETQ